MKDEIVMNDLHVNVMEKEIIKGISLKICKGQIHAMMGPNGSGKSTLALALAGHPGYKITKGTILYKGEDITKLSPDERSRKGLFLAFQYPSSIPGVSVANFLRMAVSVRKGFLTGQPAGKSDGNITQSNLLPLRDLLKTLREKMAMLKFDQSFISRSVNDGFSGGEKKRLEILQMAMLDPEFAILDETDSGLDIDALKTVADGINRLMSPRMGALIITHYQRLLNYIRPHFVHVLLDGRIVLSGGPELADELESRGYDWIVDRERQLKENYDR